MGSCGYVRMSQNAGNRFHVYTLLNGPGGEGVAEGMELYVTKTQTCKDVGEVMGQVIRVGNGAEGVKDDEILRLRIPAEEFEVPLILKLKEIEEIRCQSQVPLASFGLGRTEDQLCLAFVPLFGGKPLDGIGNVQVAMAVQVLPAECTDFSPAQGKTGGEDNSHVHEIAVGVQEGHELFQFLIFHGFHSGLCRPADHGIGNRVAAKDPLRYRRGQAAADGGTEIPDRLCGQRTAVLQPAVGSLLIEEALECNRGDLRKMKVTQCGYGMLEQIVCKVGGRGGLADRLDVGFQVLLDPIPEQGICGKCTCTHFSFPFKVD